VAGLPLVFAEKVKENLQTEYPDTTLKDLTYGRISAMVKNTSVALCNAMKIENRIKKNQQLGIKELWDFCTQYGYERITPPSTTLSRHLGTISDRNQQSTVKVDSVCNNFKGSNTLENLFSVIGF